MVGSAGSARRIPLLAVVAWTAASLLLAQPADLPSLARAGDWRRIQAMGPGVMPELARLYSSSSEADRTTIASVFYALGWPSAEAKRALMADAHTKNQALRLQVQWALGRVSADPDVVDVLLDNMQNDLEPLFRDKAACALAHDQIHLSPAQKVRLLEGLIGVSRRPQAPGAADRLARPADPHRADEGLQPRRRRGHAAVGDRRLARVARRVQGAPPMTLLALALLAAAPAVAAAPAPASAAAIALPSSSVLASYSFDDDEVATGPDTFAIWQGAWHRGTGKGRARLSSSYHLSGFRSVELTDVAGDGDFPELQGYFPVRSTGRLYFHFAFLTTDPREELNIALAGPRYFVVQKDGIAFWLGTRDGMLVHHSDSMFKKLVAVEAFVWYGVDVAYDIDAGTYGLTVQREGERRPLFSLQGQPNAARQPGSAVDKFSFVGAPFSDASNVTYYVDDVVLGTDEQVARLPFVAPGRRKLFFEMFTEYRRLLQEKPRCLPVAGPADLGFSDEDLAALRRDGLFLALQKLVGPRGRGPGRFPEGEGGHEQRPPGDGGLERGLRGPRAGRARARLPALQEGGKDASCRPDLHALLRARPRPPQAVRGRRRAARPAGRGVAGRRPLRGRLGLRGDRPRETSTGRRSGCAPPPAACWTAR